MSDHPIHPQQITSDDDDNNVDFDSDDDDDGSTKQRSKGDNKRDHHNALERRRRDLIKDSFCKLRDVVPSLQGEKASRAQILKKAAEYIQTMRKKNQTNQADIDELSRLNKMLEDQMLTQGKIPKKEWDWNIKEKPLNRCMYSKSKTIGVLVEHLHMPGSSCF